METPFEPSPDPFGPALPFREELFQQPLADPFHELSRDEEVDVVDDAKRVRGKDDDLAAFERIARKRKTLLPEPLCPAALFELIEPEPPEELFEDPFIVLADEVEAICCRCHSSDSIATRGSSGRDRS
jgi:hypothetical protein